MSLWADGLWADGFWADDFWSETVVAVAESVEQATGGYGARNAYDSYRQRQESRRRYRESILEQIEEIDDRVDKEIAQLIQKQEAISDEQKALGELETLVSRLERQDVEQIGERVAAAYIRAATQGNYSALMAFEREMERAIEDEEFLLMAVAIL